MFRIKEILENRMSCKNRNQSLWQNSLRQKPTKSIKNHLLITSSKILFYKGRNIKSIHEIFLPMVTLSPCLVVPGGGEGLEALVDERTD
jgi:hypothetical protein